MKTPIIISKNGTVLMNQTIYNERLKHFNEVLIQSIELEKKKLDSVYDYENYIPNINKDEFDYHAYHFSIVAIKEKGIDIYQHLKAIKGDKDKIAYFFYDYNYKCVFKKNASEDDIIKFIKANLFIRGSLNGYFDIFDELSVGRLVKEFPLIKSYHCLNFGNLLISRFCNSSKINSSVYLDFAVTDGKCLLKILEVILKIVNENNIELKK